MWKTMTDRTRFTLACSRAQFRWESSKWSQVATSNCTGTMVWLLNFCSTLLTLISETEHYLVTSGRGTFTIGAEEKDISISKVNYCRVKSQHEVDNWTKFPVLITIPGNVPHQVHNPHDEDLIWYYALNRCWRTNLINDFTVVWHIQLDFFFKFNWLLCE